MRMALCAVNMNQYILGLCWRVTIGRASVPSVLPEISMDQARPGYFAAILASLTCRFWPEYYPINMLPRACCAQVNAESSVGRDGGTSHGTYLQILGEPREGR
jgi:hypothetical protein